MNEPTRPEIIWHEKVTSTNELAWKAAREGARDGSAVAARVQTNGRGRGERRWLSPEGGLYLSLVVRPRLKADQWGRLPLAAGLGAARACERLVCEAGLVVKVELKWPNDLILHGRKLGGILCQGSPGEHGVLGVGVNLNTDLTGLPAKVRQLATCLPRETGHIYPLERAAHILQEALLETVEQFVREPGRARQAYSDRCLTLGQEVSWAEGAGRALEVTDTGSLLVETAAGRRELTGEVHLG